MRDPEYPTSDLTEQVLKGEIVRLKKIIRALADRAELSTSSQGSDFSLFQNAIVLEEQVRSRTAELEAALRENEKINRALRESEARFRGLVSQSLVGITIVEDGKLSYSNRKFDEIFGYRADEIRGLRFLDVVTEDDRPLVMDNIRKQLSGERQAEYVFRGVRRDGAVIDIEVHSSAMEVGGKLLIGVVMDVTERTHAEREVLALQEKLREQSTHDALTGLYNRRYLEEALDRELISAERHEHPVSVIMADLDHFKKVNDRLGHPAGDEVLRVFSDLMKRYVRGSDICCRYGGEEFLLVLPQIAKEDAGKRAHQLCSAIGAAPVRYDAAVIPVTASFGVATFPHDGRTTGELIAAADSALYAAKAAGRNRVSISSGCPSPSG